MVIVKMQRSLETTAPVQQVLIYNETRSIQLQTDMTPDLAKWFGTNDKVYAKASFKKGHLSILNTVKAQPW